MTRRRIRRRNGSTLLFVVAAVVLIIVVIAVVWMTMGGSQDNAANQPVLAKVTRGVYDHIVLEQGEVESSNNVEIRCEVRSRTSGSGPSTSIIDVIPEGTRVKEGDWLVTFDSSALEQELSRQRIVVNTSEALVIQAKALYDTALIAKEEYLEGTFNELKKTIENEIFVAEENLKKAQLSYDSIKRLVSRGLLNELQLKGEQFRVDAAQNELDLANQKLDVLEKYTKKKELTTLDSDIAASEVKWRNEQDSHQEELDNLKEIESQISKCKVVAPAAGQVVYANVRSSRSGSEFVVEPGAAVRERQEIIKLPDPSAMAVKALINESRINLIKEGMQVSIRIDAFGDDAISGEVTKVNKYAEPGNWWMSSAKEYATFIQIMEPPPSIRVGLTAEVQIQVARLPDALQMPVQAVYEKNGKTFCLVEAGNSWETRELVVGSTNDKMVAVDEERSELFNVGDQVVMNPRKHLDKFDQSRFPKEEPAGEKKGGKGKGKKGPPAGGPPVKSTQIETNTESIAAGTDGDGSANQPGPVAAKAGEPAAGAVAATGNAATGDSE